MLLGFKLHFKARVPLDHPIIALLIGHCGALRTLQVRGQDGRAVHQRARGNAGLPKLAGFGELCSYKARLQERGIGRTAWKWSTGVWLG